MNKSTNIIIPEEPSEGIDTNILVVVARFDVVSADVTIDVIIEVDFPSIIK